MRNKAVLALSGILSIFVSPSVLSACCMSISVPAGWYVDADVGVTQMNGQSYPPETPSTVTSGTGWSAAAGYKFLPYVAAEVDYTRYADTRIRDDDGVTLARDVRYSIAAAGKFIYPVANSGIEVYGKLGIGWIHAKLGHIDATGLALEGLTLDDGTRTARGLYWGGGIQYYFNENVSAHLQYAQLQGNSNTGNLGLGSIGVSILF